MDKFFTNINVAKQCIDTVNLSNFDFVIEPSAGSGNFLNQINHPNKIGIDIDPSAKGIVKQDFLTYYPPNYDNILTIGNPPFGKGGPHLAIKFFNHAAKFSKTIAFIIPKSFRKSFVQNKLDRYFHLTHDNDIPIDSFEPPTITKCCFQIWTKLDIIRPLIVLPTNCFDFDLMDNSDNCDFVIKKTGAGVGKIFETHLHKYKSRRWFYIKSKIDKQLLIEKFRKLDFSIAKQTALQETIRPGELIQLYSNIQ